MLCTVQRMWEQQKKWEKGPKSISTVPPGPMERSPKPMIINPDLGSAVCSRSVPAASTWFFSSFLFPFSFFYLHCTCWRKQNMSYTSAREEGRAKSPPTQRMLITCVLSQEEPGHPLWIKGEIVSCSLIFQCPEMFGCSLSSSFCAREIIRAHSKQQNPSLSGCWTTSPWLLWGHRCPD